MPTLLTRLLTAVTLVAIPISPWTLLATSAQEAQTVPQPILLTQSPSEIEFTDLTGFKGVIVTLEVSPDGDILLVASNDGQITAIDLSNFQTIYSLPIKANPYSDIVFSSDGQFFTVAEQQVVFVYETSTGNLLRTLREHTGNVSSLAISSDDRILVSASGQDLTLKIWDLETGELLQNIGEDVDSVSTVAFHPDGNLFVTGAGGIGSDRTVKYWGVAQDSTLPTYELVKVSPKQFGFIYDLTFDSEGEKLVGAVRNYVKVWEINRNSAEILSVKASPLEINRVAISPNSRLIATANRDNTITLIDANQKKIIGTLTGHQGWIQTITFSPDGNTLYSGAEDKIVKIWDISRF